MTLSTIPQDAPRRAETAPERSVFDALATSRANWRGIAGLAFDLCFETDLDGRFSLVSSAAFGWTEAELIGHSASALLQWPDESGFDPFQPNAPVQRHRAWLKRANGGVAAVLISSLPCRDAGGRITGAIGGIQDISEAEIRIQGMSEQLHVFRQVAAIGKAMRQAVLPDTVIRIGLEQVLEALGGYGAVIIGCNSASSPDPNTLIPSPRPTEPGSSTGQDGHRLTSPRAVVLHRAGETPPVSDSELVAVCDTASRGGTAPWSRTVACFGRTMCLSAIATHFAEPVVLALWRDASRGWGAADQALAAGVMNSLAAVLEYDQVQRALSRQSAVDTLTGLLNRESFIQQVDRRLDRLDAEGLSATLMLVGLDKFEAVNRERGYEQGDRILRGAATLLRDAVRPTDLAGRLSGDLFALWLDGADQFAAAERAEGLCKAGITVELDDALKLEVSIGLTSRVARSFESTETLLEQAQAALGAIKLAGGGRWHFFNEDLPA